MSSCSQVRAGRQRQAAVATERAIAVEPATTAGLIEREWLRR